MRRARVIEDNRDSAVWFGVLPILVLLGAGCWNVAKADWELAGAQYECDPKTKTFELLPYDRSSDDLRERIGLKPGFTQIHQDGGGFTCKLGQHTLHIVIDVFPPSGHGQGMGSGLVRARSISVSGIELLPDSPAFDWSIGDPPLTRVRVIAKGAMVTIGRCYTTFATSTVPATEHCESKDVPVVSLASARTESSRPAEPATQMALLATKLPPDNDFANAFVTHDRGGIPVCAHLSSSFLRGIGAASTPEAMSPQGRIAGKPGDRIYIRPANPQVCDASVEPLCKARSYLIPGDIVDVGFICGAWAYIRYTPPTRASSPISGWESTDSLYSVDTLVMADPQREIILWREAANDPLVDAVVARDLHRLRDLLAGGASPDGTKPKFPGVYTPLSLAVNSDALDLVNTLLAGNANANDPAVLDAALTATQAIWNALVKAGMNIRDARRPLNRLAALDRISALESEATQRGRWRPIRDLPALVQRLIDAGFPVDQKDERDQTPLTLTFPQNNTDVAQVLLRAGANPNLVSDGISALMKAMEHYPAHRDPTMISQLLGAGADANFRAAGDYVPPDDDDPPGACCHSAGQTALTMTAAAGELTLTTLLLDHGADPAMRRSDGVLPAEIARQNGHPDVAALIESYPRASVQSR